MTVLGWAQILLYCAIVVAITPVLGDYMTRVFSGERTFLSPILRPVEVAIYKMAGVNEHGEQHAVTYTIGMLLFHAGGLLLLYVLMRVQAALPFNPAEQSAVAPDLSFNTAISFITNTNWQNYGGESTMSYLVQMLGLTHQNYLSAATGIVLAVALIRGFARHSVRTIGNFWVDVTRCTLYILLPICVPYALFLIWQGIPQTLGGYVDATTLEGAKQTIAVGPVASQLREQLDYPVLEYFAADKPGLRILLGELHEMLATTETDLEPNRGPCITEERCDVEMTRCRKIYRQPRQQVVDEGLLSGTQEAARGGGRRPEDAAPAQPGMLRRRAAARPPDPASPRETAIGFGPAAEMTVGGGTPVNRLVQGEMCTDAARRQIDQLLQDSGKFLFVSGSCGIDIERQRFGDADRIGDLDRAALG